MSSFVASEQQYLDFTVVESDKILACTEPNKIAEYFTRLRVARRSDNSLSKQSRYSLRNELDCILLQMWDKIIAIGYDLDGNFIEGIAQVAYPDVEGDEFTAIRVEILADGDPDTDEIRWVARNHLKWYAAKRINS